MTLGSLPARSGTVGAPFREPEVRHEGHLKVTGAARYTGDHHPAGMLYAACLGSVVPHARITRVDTSAAERLPGVVAVLTGRELGEVRHGRHLRDLPVLAGDRVLFIGQRIAAVAAETREAAEEAVRLIEVDYEDLPPVFDPREALGDTAPVLHPDSSSYGTIKGRRKPVGHPNVQGELVQGCSEAEMEAAFAAADLVVEHSFRTPRQHHGFIEPHGAIVWFEGEICHVTSTNKAPFGLRQQMAAATGHAEEKIVVHNRFIGGDFGGKGFSLDEYVCYYLARRTGRPVRSLMPYVEELSAAAPRHAAELVLRTGVLRDGTFVAHAADVVFDGGAFAAAKANADLILHGGFDTMSAYDVPATRHRVRTVYTNSVPGGHMRAPGEVQAVFAGESHVDLIAAELGLDPVDLRRRNLPPASPVAAEVLDRATAGRPRDPGAHRGWGLALYRREGGTGRGGVVLRAVDADLFEVVTGSADQGAGTVTMLARVAAATLGVAEEQVRVVQGATADTLFDAGAGASRVTRVLGEATRLAAEELREVLAAGTGFPVEVSAEVDAPRGEDNPAFGAVAVEVAVDALTGVIRVERAVLVADTGTVINPIAHRGQLEGGFAFGLGAALMEELPVEDGQVLAGSLGDYKLPTSPDMPPLEIVTVASGAGIGPFGAKPVGEFGNLGVAPAIANAVRDAVGVRLQTLPLTSEAVWRALHGDRSDA